MKNSKLWSRTSKHFGEVSPKSTNSWTFYYYGKEEFLAKNSSCGCTTSQWDAEKRCITATYTADDIPVMSIKQGRHHLDKTVTITIQMRNEIPVVLMLKAIVIEPNLEIDYSKELTKHHLLQTNGNTNSQTIEQK